MVIRENRRVNSKSYMSFVAIIKAYPGLDSWLNRIETPEISPTEQNLPDALVKIIIGQMLSTKAASTISERLYDLAVENGNKQVWSLTHSEMRSVGLSRRKIRTIQEFSQVMNDDPERIASWPELSHSELRREVCSFWGLSKWSADMLAIFQFGQTDVFPIEDGTIKRAIQELVAVDAVKNSFDGSDASPHRSLLALALWKMVDDGVFQKFR